MAYHPKPPACSTCPTATLGRSFVPSRGPSAAPVLLLGQGPGETEAALGSPFVGPSGQKLGTWLRMAGIDQQRECRVGNVVQCWLPENREPTRAEVDHCRDAHWGVETANRRIIIPIGVPAMRQFYPKAGESTAGQIIRWEPETDKGRVNLGTPSPGTGRFESGTVSGSQLPTYVVGLLHPAFILRGNWALEPLQIQTLKLVRRILDGWVPEIQDFSKPHPNANLYPTLEQLHAWRADFQPGDEVSLDVETAGNILTMVGLCRVRDLAHVTIWFRKQGGDPWPHADWLSVVEFLYDLLADENVGKVAHNHFFDWEQLEEVGFEINGPVFDTLLACHAAQPEFRKRLESVSLLLTGACGWKALLRDGEGDKK